MSTSLWAGRAVDLYDPAPYVPEPDVEVVEPEPEVETQPEPSPLPVTETKSTPSASTIAGVGVGGGTLVAGGLVGGATLLTGAALGVNKYIQNKRDQKQAEIDAGNFGNRVNLGIKIRELNKATKTFNNANVKDAEDFKTKAANVYNDAEDFKTKAANVYNKEVNVKTALPPIAQRQGGVLNKLKDIFSIRREKENRQSNIDEKTHKLLKKEAEDTYTSTVRKPIAKVEGSPQKAALAAVRKEKTLAGTENYMDPAGDTKARVKSRASNFLGKLKRKI
jgi:hypothetical protein